MQARNTILSRGSRLRLATTSLALVATVTSVTLGCGSAASDGAGASADVDEPAAAPTALPAEEGELLAVAAQTAPPGRASLTGLASSSRMLDTDTLERLTRSLASSALPPVEAGAARLSRGTFDVHQNWPSVSFRTSRHQLQVTLDGAGPSDVEYLADGTVVYGDVAPSTDAIAHVSGDGMQFFSVLRDASAPTTQRYALALPPDTELVASQAGFALVDPTGEVLGTIAAPWAEDATGRQLPTLFELDGDTLLQTTDLTGAVFPVVADPRITLGWGIYLNLTGTEMTALAAGVVAIGGVGVGVACGTAGLIPQPVVRVIVGLMCTYVGTNTARAALRKAAEIVQNTPFDSGACYQIDLTDTGEGFRKVSHSNCG